MTTFLLPQPPPLAQPSTGRACNTNPPREKRSASRAKENLGGGGEWRQLLPRRLLSKSGQTCPGSPAPPGSSALSLGWGLGPPHFTGQSQPPALTWQLKRCGGLGEGLKGHLVQPSPDRPSAASFHPSRSFRQEAASRPECDGARPAPSAQAPKEAGDVPRPAREGPAYRPAARAAAAASRGRRTGPAAPSRRGFRRRVGGRASASSRLGAPSPEAAPGWAQCGVGGSVGFAPHPNPAAPSRPRPAGAQPVPGGGAGGGLGSAPQRAQPDPAAACLPRSEAPLGRRRLGSLAAHVQGQTRPAGAASASAAAAPSPPSALFPGRQHHLVPAEIPSPARHVGTRRGNPPKP